MLNLLPEVHQCKNKGLLFVYVFRTLNGTPVLGATAPPQGRECVLPSPHQC